MSREGSQSRFRDPLLQPISSISPSASAQVASVASFAKPKNELLHDGPLLKSGSLRGRQEAHHEILCAVIQKERTDWQALTAATLHNVSLHIMQSIFSLAARRHPGISREER